MLASSVRRWLANEFDFLEITESGEYVTDKFEFKVKISYDILDTL